MIKTGITVSVNRMIGVGKDKSTRPTVLDLTQLDEAEFQQLWNTLIQTGKETDMIAIALALKSAALRNSDVPGVVDSRGNIISNKLSQLPNDQFVAMWNQSSQEDKWKAVSSFKNQVRGGMSVPSSSFDDISDILE